MKMEQLPSSTSVDDGFEAFHVLYFIDEQITQSCTVGIRHGLFDELIELVRSGHITVFAAIEVEVDEIGFRDSLLKELVENCDEQAGFAASADAGDYFDETGIVVERTELGQIVLSAIGAHVVLLVTF